MILWRMMEVAMESGKLGDSEDWTTQARGALASSCCKVIAERCKSAQICWSERNGGTGGRRRARSIPHRRRCLPWAGPTLPCRPICPMLSSTELGAPRGRARRRRTGARLCTRKCGKMEAASQDLVQRSVGRGSHTKTWLASNEQHPFERSAKQIQALVEGRGHGHFPHFFSQA